MSKDYTEVCDELAELIKSGNFINPGFAIQQFFDFLQDDETPAMALAMVKSDAALAQLEPVAVALSVGDIVETFHSDFGRVLRGAVVHSGESLAVKFSCFEELFALGENLIYSKIFLIRQASLPSSDVFVEIIGNVADHPELLTHWDNDVQL